MVTLVEIQELVDKAQRKIEEGDLESVQKVLWPDIKSKLGQCTELQWEEREYFQRHVFKDLNEHKLHATPRRINLEELRRRQKQGKAKAPETEHRHYWIPW